MKMVIRYEKRPALVDVFKSTPNAAASHAWPLGPGSALPIAIAFASLAGMTTAEKFVIPGKAQRRPGTQGPKITSLHNGAPKSRTRPHV